MPDGWFSCSSDCAAASYLHPRPRRLTTRAHIAAGFTAVRPAVRPAQTAWNIRSMPLLVLVLPTILPTTVRQPGGRKSPGPTAPRRAIARRRGTGALPRGYATGTVLCDGVIAAAGGGNSIDAAALGWSSALLVPAEEEEHEQSRSCRLRKSGRTGTASAQVLSRGSLRHSSRSGRICRSGGCILPGQTM